MLCLLSTGALMPGSLLNSGGSMLKLFVRFALITTLVGVVSAVSAIPASAARPCAKPGYEVFYRDSTNIVLRKDVSKEFWEDVAWSFAVCSRQFGRAVYIGDEGITPDGPVWSELRAMNSRYAAVVHGSGGNADGGEDGGIFVVDLKTGREISSSEPSTPDMSHGEYINTVALSTNGAVGWTIASLPESDTSDEPDYSTGVYVRYPQRRVRQAAMGAGINGNFLRWSDDATRLIWTESSTVVPYEWPRYAAAKTRKTGKCLRAGDRVEGRAFGYVYLSRPYFGRGWKGARSLIACSYSYRQRVTIARSGVREGNTYAFRAPKVNTDFAAVVIDRTSSDGSKLQLFSVHDLGRARRVCQTDVVPGSANAKIGAIEFESGATFWNATDDANSTHLRVCDRYGARTLHSSTTSDRAFLTFQNDGQGDRFGITVAAGEKSGS